MRLKLRHVKQNAYTGWTLEFINMAHLTRCDWPQGNPIRRDFEGWWSLRVGRVEIWWNRRDWYWMFGLTSWKDGAWGLCFPNRNRDDVAYPLVLVCSKF